MKLSMKVRKFSSMLQKTSRLCHPFHQSPYFWEHIRFILVIDCIHEWVQLKVIKYNANQFLRALLQESDYAVRNFESQVPMVDAKEGRNECTLVIDLSNRSKEGKSTSSVHRLENGLHLKALISVCIVPSDKLAFLGEI